MAVKVFKNTKVVLLEFTVKKNIRQTIIMAALATITIVASAVGFAAAYPDEASRALVAKTFASNSGLIAFLGKPDTLATIGGFTAWRALGATTLILGIWALFLSTRIFRGDEEQGRLELILTGSSSLVNASKQLFAAVCVMMVPLSLIITIPTLVVSTVNNYGWAVSSILFLTSNVVLTVLLFASIGMLASQLAATRAAALKIGATIFAVSFMLRALGDITTSQSWLSAISPLGWLERMHPLTSSNTLWYIPIITVILLCVGASLIIARNRDYSASVLPDKDSAKPKYRLLNSSSGLLLRLHKTNALLWIVGLFVINILFGTFLSSAIDAIQESNGLGESFNKVINSTSGQSAELFVGVIFMQMMLLLLIMVVGQSNSFREDEARGYMDNLLVRQGSRISLSTTKVLLIVGSLILTCIAITAGMYLGAASQDISLNTNEMLLAGLNLLAMPVLFLGLAMLFFGFVPRLMSALLYGLIGWTFVIEIIGSVININHWILDTSLLHHIALAPAADVKWNVFGVYIALGITAAIIGLWRFTKRDIELM